MNDPNRAFLEIPRRDPGYRGREERLEDWREVERALKADALRDQAARCMDCGVPFCHGLGCPLENRIPEFNEWAGKGRWEEAWEVLSATDPLAEFTARLCPAPCEGACVAGLHGRAVAIRQVERMIVERAFQEGRVVLSPPASPARGRAAVIGSGPAGLAAAWRLNRRGWDVVVFERDRKPGGLLRYGIPDFKLEKWVVDRRIRIMQQGGIVFESGIDVGRDVSARYLRDRFDAILLAGGARAPRDLAVPGRELEGVHFAMDYLARQNRRNDGEPVPEDRLLSARGRAVVVVGGGDTGADCLGTALRQGARKVCQLEILPRPPPDRPADNPWPEWPMVFRESSSHQEGGERRWNVLVRRLEGREGRVVRLHACEGTWEAQASGPPVFRETPGTDFSLEADLVLLAMGFAGPGPNRIAETLGLETDARGFIRRDAVGMTSSPGVFIAGDMAEGASLIVRALADGQRVAGRLDAFVEGRAG